MSAVAEAPLNQPRFPLYIPTKSRAAIATTPRFLDSIGVPYRLVVEAEQVDVYAEHFGEDRLIVLDPAYQESYDTCDDLGGSFSRGSGPARNFIWDHAAADGHAWHWIMDDNIRRFARLHDNQRVTMGDGTGFHAMEDFALRYENVAMVGPQYWMFAPSRVRSAPFAVGTRVYSCNLIRTDLPFRWRGRYNEDTILSLDLLKAGWQTIVFNAFLQEKLTTQQLPGGNTEAFYAAKGTLPKSEMLVREHPDVTRVVWRYGRWHHEVDYSAWSSGPLVPDPAWEPPEENPYRLLRVPRDRKAGRRR